MRTRMFLRTSEFLWQEGHTAHATREEALEETHRALEMYRACVEEDLAMPVIAGEKPENERFPGADETWSIEAMMQDGKALQAGTSHYLGTNFAKAAGIQYQDSEGTQQYCHTTSWGTSTRLIGGVVMTHGDDDGLRVPPRIAPHQIVILPMLRDKPEDEAVLAYCEELRATLADQWSMGEKQRVLFDKTPGKATAKRWDWVRKGAPVIIEVGPRDMEEGKVAMLRRDRLWNADNGKPNMHFIPRDEFISGAAALLEEIQNSLFDEARARRDANITRGVTQWREVTDFFASNGKFPGWVEVQWAKPTGDQLEKVVEQLKGEKLTIRNVPRDGAAADGICVFTGAKAVERILVARAY
jgi:prolyl-tRNA synthetase